MLAFIKEMLEEEKLIGKKKNDKNLTLLTKIRVYYKSGNSHEFWVTKFEYKGGTYTWRSVGLTNIPIVLGAGDIEAVYQIGIEFINTVDLEQ